MTGGFGAARPKAGLPGIVVVDAAGLVKTYRRGPEEVHALQGVDLMLSVGEVVGLVGRSGSGKTTLLNLIAGWEQPDAGDIFWQVEDPPSSNGRRPPKGEPSWARLSIVPQALGLIEELPVRENVALPLRLSRTPDADGRVDALLESLGLDALAARLPTEVSLGEQQRAALARALVVRPAVLLADEPTGHQDAGWSTGVFEAIRAAAAEGTACLVATHNEEVLRFTTRVLSIADGRFSQAPPPPPPSPEPEAETTQVAPEPELERVEPPPAAARRRRAR